MKSTVKLMEVKGLKVPDFNEPKGEEFKKVMQEINLKVQTLQQKKNNSINLVNNCNQELNKIKYQLMITEDDFEKLELKKRKKELQEELETIEDYSDLDIKAYRRKLIDDSKVQQLLTEAAKEYQRKRGEVDEYQKEITRQFERTVNEIWRFIADGGSDSDFKTAYRIYSALQ